MFPGRRRYHPEVDQAGGFGTGDLMALLLTNRRFRRLWSAGFFFLLATWSLYTAVPVRIYQETGSALASGVVLVVISLPGILLGPVAGVLVDRWDRQRVMSWGAIALAAVMLAAIPLAIGTIGAAGSALPALYGIVLLEATVYAFFSPAESALLPTLVEEADLNATNSLNGLNDNLARIAGPVVGAFVLGLFGFGATLAVCAVLYGLGWLVLRGLRRVPGDITEPDVDAPEPAIVTGGWLGSLWGDLRIGLTTVAASRQLLIVMAVFALVVVADTPLSAVLPAFVAGSLGAGAAGYGTVVSVRGIAGVLGGVTIASVGHRFHETRLVAAGSLVLGLGIILIGVAQSFVVTLVVMVAMGPAIAAFQTGLATLLQKHSEDATRGRVFGLLGTGTGLISLLASLAGGGVAELTSPPVVVVASGALYLLPVGLILAVFRQRSRQGDA